MVKNELDVNISNNLKYKKNETYIMAFLNENGLISNQSFIKNCTIETEVKVYKNFVVYRMGHSILLQNHQLDI